MFGDGRQTRDWVEVSDVARANVIAADSDVTGPVNIGTGREVPVIDRILKEYDGKVRLVFRHYPLDFHTFAGKAAEAGACAQDQGKFWELHDKMFSNQGKLAVDDLKGYAKSVGMDASKFDKCLDSGEKKALVEEDMKAGSAAGVNGTPAFFINGVFINGAQPYEQIKQTVDRELKRKG